MKGSSLVKVIFAAVVILLITQSLFAQVDGNKKINFVVENEKLSIALYRLSSESGINFTYNAGDSLYKTIISYSAVNQSPIVILDKLLTNTKFGYKQIGNQVVIFTDPNKIEISPVVEEITKKDVGVNPLLVTKPTKPLRDTIYINDTIVEILRDTIVVVDTVFLEKTKLKKPSTAKIKEIPVDYFNPMVSREEGWSGGVFFAPVVTDFSLIEQDNSLSFRNFSLGIELTKMLKNWNITGGFKLTHFAEKYNNTDIITDGGYYLTDTIDEYYTVSQIDTTWYYVTDSTWEPVNSYEYSYNINNRIGYFEISAAVSYDYYKNRKLRLYLKGGAQMGFLIYRNGVAISESYGSSGVNFADLNFNTVSYSVIAGAGLKYRINEDFDFNSELYYFYNFNNAVVDYPIDNRIVGLGLKLGLIYYF